MAKHSEVDNSPSFLVYHVLSLVIYHQLVDGAEFMEVNARAKYQMAKGQVSRPHTIIEFHPGYLDLLRNKFNMMREISTNICRDLKQTIEMVK